MVYMPWNSKVCLDIRKPKYSALFVALKELILPRKI